MTNTIKLVCFSAALLTVSACSGYRTYEQTPYQGRTAGSGVVVTQQAPAPVVETRSAQPIFKEAVRK